MKTYTYALNGAEKPKQIIVLLHGLGSDGKDLISLAPYFSAALPDAVFVSPDAPFPCDMAPMGYQWFSLQDRDEAVMLEGVKKAAPLLNDYLDSQLKQYDLPAEKLALVGFSQGTMMSLYTAPRYPKKIAGVLGYSGALLWDEDTDTDALQKMPMHLIHGDSDDVVPVKKYFHAQKHLEAAGYTVTGGVTPGLTHSIDEAGIESGSSFLQGLFS